MLWRKDQAVAKHGLSKRSMVLQQRDEVDEPEGEVGREAGDGPGRARKRGGSRHQRGGVVSRKASGKRGGKRREPASTPGKGSPTGP